MLKRLLRRLGYEKADYRADGLAVRFRNLSFLSDPAFDDAWRHTKAANDPGWRGNTPDVRWRLLMCLTAARQALLVPGDFVECGVHTGIYSVAICHALHFGSIDRTF